MISQYQNKLLSKKQKKYDALKSSYQTIIFLFVCFCFVGLLPACKVCYKLDNVPGIGSPYNLAMVGHSRQQVLLAAVNAQGELFTSGSSSPGNWSVWQSVAAGINRSTSPVLISDGTTAHLFARGTDNQLQHFTKTNLDWVPVQFTSETQTVRGRISVTVTRGNDPSGSKIFHLVFSNAPHTVKYMRLQDGNTLEERIWPEVEEAVIGSDNACLIMIAFRKVQALEFSYANRANNWNFLSTGRITYSGRRISWDLSELVWLPTKQMFSTIAVSAIPRPDFFGYDESTVDHIQILPVPGGEPISSTVNPFPLQISNYKLKQEIPPKASLANYRNKLVAVWRSPKGAIQYARWDDADIQTPWINQETFKICAKSQFRPTLAPLSKSVIGEDYNNPNYGNDLFLAISDQNVMTKNFSRMILKNRISDQFLLMQMDTFASCGKPTDPHPAYPISVFAEERPFITELGFNLWMFPHRFIKGFYKKSTRVICNGSLRGQPCSRAKMPAIVTRHSGLYICQGVFFNVEEPATRIYEELGHYMAIGMGWINNGSGPTQADANRCGIPLARLQEGYNIFTERTSSNPEPSPRRRGFTGHAGNYDVRGREHSFLYAALYYISRSQEIREFIQEDLAVENNLLQRKYNWIKTNIFRGIEFL